VSKGSGGVNVLAPTRHEHCNQSSVNVAAILQRGALYLFYFSGIVTGALQAMLTLVATSSYFAFSPASDVRISVS
jgi:hypothetical protein